MSEDPTGEEFDTAFDKESVQQKRQRVQAEDWQNKFTLNQRGGTIDINNSTNREAVNISQYSGSNIKFTNTVTSELATNNKQITVNNDSFETVKNNKTIYAGKDIVLRAGENIYNLKGFKDNDEIEAAKEYKKTYQPVADNNAQSEILRGGTSYPGGISTPQSGERSPNPTENQEVYVADSKYPDGAYTDSNAPAPQRKRELDEVQDYTKIDPQTPNCYQVKNPSPEDIESATGGGGYASNEPGTMEYPGENASTERGVWAPNSAHENLKEQVLEVQKELQPIEEKMGNGGNEEEFVYGDKVEVIGATFNDYASYFSDPEGRSQATSMAQGKEAAFANVGAVPWGSEIDNDSMFPVGNYDLTVGNRYNVKVGSGGVQIKSTGGVEIGGTTFKVAANKTNIQSADGVSISSESIVELQSKNNISLRSNRQIYIEPGLGVKNNVIVGGSITAQGEIYAHHITAPAEIQQTEDVQIFGKLKKDLKFRCKLKGFKDTDGDSMVNAEGTITLMEDSDSTGPADGVETWPHSHHFKNLPLRLTDSNTAVNEIAQAEGINVNGYQGSAQCVSNEYKQPVAIDPDGGGDGGGGFGEVLREGIKPVNVSPRCLYVPQGTRLVNQRDRVQADGVLKQEFPELPKEGIKPNVQKLTEEQIQEMVDNATRATLGNGPVQRYVDPPPAGNI